MQFLQQARDTLAAINPAFPALVLIVLLWAPQAAIRRWLPRLWELPASWGPQWSGLRQVWQALPSAAAGALFAALSSGGDPWQATWGAVVGLAAPALHHALKASPLPYQGELGAQRVKDDDIDDDPPKPPRIHLMALAVMLVGCAHQEPPPCDPASYAQLAATCGDDPDICDAAIEEREAFCAKRISEEP